jgi:hypothetical protein
MFPSQGSVENLFFMGNSLILFCSYEGDPLSPPNGRQHAGSMPYSLFWFDFSINLLMIIALVGDDESGGG